jgi:hypothetical protein
MAKEINIKGNFLEDKKEQSRGGKRNRRNKYITSTWIRMPWRTVEDRKATQKMREKYEN